MKHLLEYESYENPITEGAIPVYDEDEFVKNTKSKPDMEIKWTQIPAVVEGLLNKVENGELQTVTVVADIPTQGKNAPAYVRDLMTKERERMAQRQQAIHGSRIERSDRPEEEEYRDEINVFVDSEYTIEGVVREVGKDYLIGIPASFVNKVKREPSLKEYYTVKITPQQIIEIYYVKAK
jgi:hypothetical protein